jgi:hypothetical protein
VVRSSDLPPGHHGGPLHPLAGLHAVRHIAARLPGEYGRLPVIQNVAVANKHIHSPAMGPFILPEAEPVSEHDSVEATLESFHSAAGRGVYHACDHHYLYLLRQLSPMQVLEHLLQVAIPKNQTTPRAPRSAGANRWPRCRRRPSRTGASRTSTSTRPR